MTNACLVRSNSNAEMESKFQEMLTKSLTEAMPTIIRGAAEALKADRKYEEESSKHSRSRKSVEKPKSRNKAQLIPILVFMIPKTAATTVAVVVLKIPLVNLIGRNIGKPS
jgi:hypothetical protein